MIALRTVPVTCQAQKSIVFCRAHWSFGCPPVPVPTSGGRRLVTVALNAVAACTDRPRWRVCACDCAWPAVPVSLVSLALISLGFACARCGNCRGAGAGAGTTLPGEACPFRRCRYRDPSHPPTGTASPIHHPTPRAPCLPVRRFLQPQAALAFPARQSSTYPIAARSMEPRLPVPRRGGRR